MESFYLQGHPSVALHNLLKLLGWCDSGGQAKQLVAEGQVMVDGQIETRKRCKIIAGQIVSYAGQQVKISSSA